MTKKQTLICVPVIMILMISKEKAKRREAAFKRYWKGRKLCDFTRRECEMLRRECNFTPEELQVFDLRAGSAMIVAASRKAAMSERTVNRRVASIKRKIFRVMRR